MATTPYLPRLFMGRTTDSHFHFRHLGQLTQSVVKTMFDEAAVSVGLDQLQDSPDSTTNYRGSG